MMSTPKPHRVQRIIQWVILGALSALIIIGMVSIWVGQDRAADERHAQSAQIEALYSTLDKANSKLTQKGEDPLPVPTVTTNPNTGKTTVIQGEPGSPGNPGQPGSKGDKGDPGAPGKNATDDQVSAAVTLYCSLHSCKGEDGASIIGPAGPAGHTGEPGKDGQSITGPPGSDGTPGKDGQSATDAQVAAAVAAYCDAHDTCRGPAGKDGASGKDGAAGPPGPTGAKGDTGATGPAGPTCPDGYTLTNLYLQTRTDPMLPTTQHWEQSVLCLPATG